MNKSFPLNRALLLNSTYHIKVWARYGVSGLSYDFDIYLGKLLDSDICKEYGKVGSVFLKLVKLVGHQVYI